MSNEQNVHSYYMLNHRIRDSLFRGVAWVFEDVRTIRNFLPKRRRHLQVGGVWGHAPPENFEI